MITVTGAVIVFSTFPGASVGRSLSFASCERRKTNRPGLPLALVGDHFITSYSCRSVVNIVVNLVAALVAYTYQEKKPSLNLTVAEQRALPALTF